MQLLFPYPWLFGSGLALAAFAMTLLGGIGERYAAVAQATLILAIYTAIGLEHRAGMAGGFVLFFLSVHPKPWLALLVAVALAACALFVVSRPSAPQ